jgi:parallel beta-helix repeat protein
MAMLFMSLLAFAFNIQTARAQSGTIYINPDGSISSPVPANITTHDNFTYTFTGNNYLPIVVHRSNIIINGMGHTLQGNGSASSIGFSLPGVSLVTIENTTITNSGDGIYLYSSSSFPLPPRPTHNVLSGNNVTSNVWGIYLNYSSSNVLSGNNVKSNGVGIYLNLSINNVLSGNNVTANGDGIDLYYSSGNVLFGNNITANYYGILLYGSSVNWIFHNNFLNNTEQAYVSHPVPPTITPVPSSIDTWDDGYPSGGNYWSDYTGLDLYRGPYQNLTGSDGIGDTPYVIFANNTDYYPLMEPWPSHDTAITSFTPSKTFVGQGYGLSVSFTAADLGDYTETFNATVHANASIIATFTNITLTSRNSTTIKFTWNTTRFAFGNYTISASVTLATGEANRWTGPFTYGRVKVTIPGDANGDGTVDAQDFFILERAWGSWLGQPGYDPRADFNGDGVVDAQDLYILEIHWGMSLGYN